MVSITGVRRASQREKKVLMVANSTGVELDPPETLLDPLRHKPDVTKRRRKRSRITSISLSKAVIEGRGRNVGED